MISLHIRSQDSRYSLICFKICSKADLKGKIYNIYRIISRRTMGKPAHIQVVRSSLQPAIHYFLNVNGSMVQLLRQHHRHH